MVLKTRARSITGVKGHDILFGERLRKRKVERAEQYKENDDDFFQHVVIPIGFEPMTYPPQADRSPPNLYVLLYL